jgi:hypothetical protein
MPTAVVLSVLLHLAFGLVSLLVPLDRMAAIPVRPEDSALEFTFSEPADEERTEGRKQGDVPFDMPEQQQEQASAAESNMIPEGIPSLDTPNMPTPEQAAEPPPAEPLLEDPLEPLEAEDSTAEESEPVEEQVDDPADDPEQALETAQLTEAAAGSFAAPREEQQPPPPPQRTSQADLNERLSQFGRALERAREEQPRPPSGGAPRNTFRPEPAGLPSTGFGAGQLHFESGDYDWGDYARQIYMALWRAWHNRLYLTTYDFERWAHENGIGLLNHQAGVRFVIEANGHVSGIRLEGPSGCTPLDASAVDAMAEVVLPPLPSDFPRDAEVVHVRFIAVGEIMAMKPMLGYYKRAGFF